MAPTDVSSNRAVQPLAKRSYFFAWRAGGEATSGRSQFDSLTSMADSLPYVDRLELET